VHAKNIGKVLKTNQNCLFPAYLELSGEMGKALSLKKIDTRYKEGFKHVEIDGTIEREFDPHKRLALQEFKAAQWTVETQTAKAEAEQRREQEEADNLDRAKADGTTGECECCCDEFALNRMVHCNADTIHWFCRACARRSAETEIGLSKYELTCMSMDGCTGDFSRDQRNIFLDENLTIALERIEQEAVLRLAGIENLETCPFCPFAAEYPPVDEDKEFRCLKPDCERVSCRLCRRETHIPKSCHEAALESGQSARRVIEEAMSAAMIRKCNKCELKSSTY
jgi:TRIAD3 protein (E3 ubiquitin-protein ligase RNF216)